MFSTKVMAEGAGQVHYKFGVFPYLSAVLLDEIYASVTADLSRELNQKVSFRTSSNFKRFFENLSKQKYDFALIQPFWYPPAVDEFNYQPLVRIEEPFTSLIMVLDDSPIKTIADIKGKVIATPPAFVPVVHMAKKDLISEGLVPGKDVTLKAFKTVDSCFQQLLIGTAQACVSPPFVPPIVEEKMKVKLRVLLKTFAIPNLSLVVNARVPEKDRIKIKNYFLNLAKTDSGKAFLQKIKAQGFIQANDQDYNVVREFLSEIKASKQ
ncbi:MAG: phosphate/phosphite/phosphonate ABC transporter substrate-binding protein [Gammaproteobacteria bacterium]|nr:phosphate/phosphite/phosphonate ABC transporter substrate-binding protein [Gammaproteobacteria bacterium]